MEKVTVYVKDLTFDFPTDEMPKEMVETPWTTVTWDDYCDLLNDEKYETPVDFLKAINADKIYINNKNMWNKPFETEELFVIPVYRHYHTSVSYSTEPFGIPFDSGQIGYAWVSKEEVANFWSVDGEFTEELKNTLIKKHDKALKAYGDFVNGYATRVTLKDKNDSIVFEDYFYGIGNTTDVKNFMKEHGLDMFYEIEDMKYKF